MLDRSYISSKGGETHLLGLHEPSLTLVVPPTPAPKTRTRKVEAMPTTITTAATTAVVLLSRCHVLDHSFARVFVVRSCFRVSQSTVLGVLQGQLGSW